MSSYLNEKGQTVCIGQEALDKFAEAVGARLTENRKSKEAGTGVDQDMRRAILGHHQDIMVDPQVRESLEHGIHGMRWGAHQEKAEQIENLKALHDKIREDPREGSVDPLKANSYFKFQQRVIPELAEKIQAIGRDDPRVAEDVRRAQAAAQKAAENYDKKSDAQSANSYNNVAVAWLHSALLKLANPRMVAAKREAQEHGVQGMKWGIRHTRKDAAGQKSLHAMQRDLMHDLRTLSMMKTVGVANEHFENLKRNTIQVQQQGQKVTPQSSHGEALNILKGLGWQVLQAGLRVTGLGGQLGSVISAVRAPTGQKLFMNTQGSGDHYLSTDRRGRAPVRTGPSRRARTSVRESRRFEIRLGRFLREARKGRTHYCRPLNRYGTKSEKADLEMLAEAFPGSKIDYARTQRHADLGMGYFHDKIDGAKRVVLRPDRKNRLTLGVYSEARHAIKQKIPTYAIYKGKLRRIKAVRVLKNANNEGHFGKLVFKSRKGK